MQIDESTPSDMSSSVERRGWSSGHITRSGPLDSSAASQSTGLELRHLNMCFCAFTYFTAAGIGGGGSGPCGGGAVLIGRFAVCDRALRAEELDVRGGNIGREEGSTADMGSKAARDADLVPLGISLVSRERCSSDKVGGGAALADLIGPFSPKLRGISPEVGVSFGMFDEVVEAVVAVELVDVEVGNATESREPSLLIALGAGGAR